jgi:preprotein translocase subunit SecG
MRRVVSLVVTVLVAAVLVIGLMLLLQSRDDGSLDRPTPARSTAIP